MSSSARLLNLVLVFKQHVAGQYAEEQTPRTFYYESAKKEQLKCLEEEEKKNNLSPRFMKM